MIINEENYGKEFCDALVYVLDVRKKKRLVYGDEFLNDDILFLKYQIENKLKRLNAQIENGELKELKENTETAIDSLIDMINYALFMICKIQRGDRK